MNSSNSTDPNTCYNVVHEDGYKAADKLIAKCHEVGNPVIPKHHSKEYIDGLD
ncbi:MAG: hypothetical protein WAM14_13075 [Candidatus Nitrosopolaris sp.]